VSLAATGLAAPRPGRAANAELAGYRVTYLGSEDVANDEYEETRALVRVDAPDGTASLATPSLRRYRTGAMRDTAEVAILDGVWEDFYVEARQFVDTMRRSDGSLVEAGAILKVHLNPLTWFLWAGAGVMSFGAVVAAVPGRRRKKDEARSWIGPAGAAALLGVAATAVVWFLFGPAWGAMAAAGIALAAGLVAGAFAAHAVVAPAAAEGASEAEGEAPERIGREIDVERSMGRWEEKDR